VDGKPVYGNFFGQSSFSRLALVNSSSLNKVPHETDLKLFAPLGCGIQTGSGVVCNVLNVQQGDSLIVSGCGAVGMSAIMAAKARGAAIIVAVDIKESRLTLARELGATHTFNGGAEDLIQQVHAVCPLPAGVKFAFDTSAVPKVIEAMIEAVGVRGRVVVVGATPLDKTISIQPLKFLDMGKQFVGSVGGESYPPEVRDSAEPEHH
jgi:Zn-dependent alcohol dehydrogenase